MNILKDPKTNWKYILIVVGLAVVVGGGILSWKYIGRIRNLNCNAIPPVVILGESTRWSVSYSGGTTPLTFQWEGDEGLKVNARQATKTYSTEGTKKAVFTVTDSWKRRDSATCEVKIVPRLTVSGCSADRDFVKPGEKARWTVSYSGGNPPYSFNWIGDDGIKEDAESIIHIYQDNGIYEMAVTVKDSIGQVGHATSEVAVTSFNVLGCSGAPTPAAVGELVKWDLSFRKGLPPYDFIWDGSEGLKGNAAAVSKVYLEKGEKEARVCGNDATKKTECTTCQVKVKDSTFVFLSSGEYYGNFGGIEGVDDVCQQLATEAYLSNPESYKAWISDSDTFVKDRFFHSPLPYKLINGEIIAENWEDLIDGDIKRAINIDESGNSYNSAVVWTGTDRHGLGFSSPSYNCRDWSSRDCTAMHGIIELMPWGDWRGTWTDGHGIMGGEAARYRIYCFEQLR